ncbi:DNA methyltransferase [Chloroflexota bacterium]
MRDDLDSLRQIEGFPIGEDEDLHALSDPPYYTAYPNPHIADFIEKYGTIYDEGKDDYHREPYVSDVSEGKNDPIYNAHSYHTKVPYKAIIPFIEHYTEPGDIVYDGFCGTGMTGVAAQMSERYSVVCDLSTIASFISYNINSTIDIERFKKRIESILRDVEKEVGWLYQTRHSDQSTGLINYTIWSDVFVCSYCNHEIIYWDSGLDPNTGKSLSQFDCPNCGAKVKKNSLEHAFTKIHEESSGTRINVAMQKPVQINYSVGKKRFTKKPDKNDLATLEKVENSHIPYWYPSLRMPDGDEARRNDRVGMTHAHHYYTKRNLWALAAIYARLSPNEKYEMFWFTSLHSRLHRLNRYMANHNRHVGPLSGTLYVSSTPVEINVISIARNKLKSMIDAGIATKYFSTKTLVTNQSTTDLRIVPDSSIDYIFTDPPFGSNLMYSDLNFLLETWLKIYTNSGTEAVISNTQSKNLDSYRDLMTRSFSEMYRILKPGRWITVEFHNSKASVWNAIQEALSRAGFLVAQVTIIDKQKGTTKQLTYPSAVKNDLVINAYKPRAGFTQRFISQAGSRLEADFVRQHLHQLPLAANAERSKEMLFSKYLAYYIQHGYQVHYNGEQFYHVLPEWGLVERDGYWFVDEAQAQEYEQRKVRQTPRRGKQPPAGQQVLFISDEKSARLWLWGFINAPKTYDEIYTAYVKSLQTSRDQIPELKEMLEEGFVRANGEWKRPDAFTQAELEERRQERLLRQFDEYLEKAKAGQRLKEVRIEALVVGFTECYQQNRFEDILAVGRKLHKRLLEENADLFDFIDIAEAKLEL